MSIDEFPIATNSQEIKKREWILPLVWHTSWLGKSFWCGRWVELEDWLEAEWGRKRMRENEGGFAGVKAETRTDWGGFCWIDISIGSWLLGFSLVVTWVAENSAKFSSYVAAEGATFVDEYG